MLFRSLANGEGDRLPGVVIDVYADTAVLRLDVDEASAKARSGGPIDEPEDMDLPVWAGVVPCALTWGSPEPDRPRLGSDP